MALTEDDPGLKMVMCLDCGEFVPATKIDGEWLAQPNACPECDGENFERLSDD